MIRQPPISTLSSSSAASDVYKRQQLMRITSERTRSINEGTCSRPSRISHGQSNSKILISISASSIGIIPVSYTHLRAHETPEHLVCRLLLEKKNNKSQPKSK
eukprot:TRINITY_DN66162_c0_g1_i1.p1 TRINITY_DN66162_c0_g1~~TRINITY_DN66162_c0_g1_i1.p1  ORF type:complete len:103 (-),score=9.17 TRINITY_DN66162_c0_g1_i1:12-320(-)